MLLLRLNEQLVRGLLYFLLHIKYTRAPVLCLTEVSSKRPLTEVGEEGALLGPASGQDSIEGLHIRSEMWQSRPHAPLGEMFGYIQMLRHAGPNPHCVAVCFQQ